MVFKNGVKIMIISSVHLSFFIMNIDGWFKYNDHLKWCLKMVFTNGVKKWC